MDFRKALIEIAQLKKKSCCKSFCYLENALHGEKFIHQDDAYNVW